MQQLYGFVMLPELGPGLGQVLPAYSECSDFLPGGRGASARGPFGRGSAWDVGGGRVERSPVLAGPRGTIDHALYFLPADMFALGAQRLSLCNQVAMFALIKATD